LSPTQYCFTSRRAFLRSVSHGFGALAYAALTHTPAPVAAQPAALPAAQPAAQSGVPATANPALGVKPPHFAPRAKRVLMMTMEGGPSHIDTFDYKPELAKRAGKPIGKGRLPNAKLMPSPWEFQQAGQSGLWISDLYPELRRQADKLCLVNSMQTDVPAHATAFIQLHTGIATSPRPSLGAWVLYALGTDNANLPGFVTISAPAILGGPVNYGSAFLPASYQATKIGGNRQLVTRAQVANIKSPRSKTTQEEQLAFIESLNAAERTRSANNAFLDGLSAAHALAYRMQGELPPVIDLNRESAATQAQYGIGDSSTDDFGRQCLMARRLLESGVRFVEVCHGGWDQHRNLREDHGKHAGATDKPIAGLLADLSDRGMLKDTLVLWGGEFGRTPYAQTDDGRDHNHLGYTMWMAGGGVKGGLRYGATDDFGHEAVTDKVHIHDWHATILHLLGLDHERLTFPYAGRDMRLTDVKGRVHKGLIG
jgi:hypothetical protein